MTLKSSVLICALSFATACASPASPPDAAPPSQDAGGEAPKCDSRSAPSDAWSVCLYAGRARSAPYTGSETWTELDWAPPGGATFEGGVYFEARRRLDLPDGEYTAVIAREGDVLVDLEADRSFEIEEWTGASERTEVVSFTVSGPMPVWVAFRHPTGGGYLSLRFVRVGPADPLPGDAGTPDGPFVPDAGGPTPPDDDPIDVDPPDDPPPDDPIEEPVDDPPPDDPIEEPVDDPPPVDPPPEDPTEEPVDDPPPDDPPGPAVPTFETAFSRRPADDGRDTTIESKLVSLIDGAVAGSVVRVAIFSFTRSGPSAALVRAHARGVDVKVLVDAHAETANGSEIPTLRASLGRARVHVCDAPGSACVGSGIMHHKTFLFSQLADGSRSVVVQASHNLTNQQLTMHNNAVIVRGDEALFDAYLRTFDDLERDVEIRDYYRSDDGDGPARVYFFPRPGGGDTAVSILDNVRCDASSQIRVAMAFFTDARVAVADALARRARAGCDVRVVAGDAEIPIGGTVASRLGAAGITLVRYPERSGGWSLHSKYLLIDAPYAGSTAHRRLVFTGSHNWTGPALTINDETLLRVENDAVFAAYLDDWGRVRDAARRP